MDSVGQRIRLADGRTLGYATWGDPEGAPLVYLHGSLSSRIEGKLLHAAGQRYGVQVIAVDRPGHGLSTVRRRRTFRSFALDLAQLAARLGLEQFGLAGWSGGASHAATAAQFLRGRVTRVSLIAPMAPTVANDGVAGRPLLVRAFERLSRVSTLHLRFTAWTIKQLIALRGERLFSSLPPSIFGASDRAAMADASFTQLLTSAWHEGLRTSTRAPAADVALLLRPWDILPEESDCPVDIWCGYEDRIAHFAHGQWMARRFKQSALHLVPSQGHLLLQSLAHDIVSPHGRLPASRAA